MFQENLATFKDSTRRLSKVVTGNETWFYSTIIGKEIIKQNFGSRRHGSFSKDQIMAQKSEFFT